MKRREFITLLGGAAAAWPLAARAQQPAMPVIGFLDSHSADALCGASARHFVRASRKAAMSRARTSRSNIAGRKINSIDCRRWRPIWFADGSAVIVSDLQAPFRLCGQGGNLRLSPSSSSIADDPVRLGLVDSLARPGGNLTGINFFAKRIDGEAAGAPCAS